MRLSAGCRPRGQATIVYKNIKLLRLCQETYRPNNKRAYIAERICACQAASSSLEIDGFDEKIAALDDLDPPRAAGGAGEIRVRADGLAAAVGAAQLHRDGDDLQAGRLGERTFLKGVESRPEELGTTPAMTPTLRTTRVTFAAPCRRASSSRTSKTDVTSDSSCTARPQAPKDSTR